MKKVYLPNNFSVKIYTSESASIDIHIPNNFFGSVNIYIENARHTIFVNTPIKAKGNKDLTANVAGSTSHKTFFLNNFKAWFYNTGSSFSTDQRKFLLGIGLLLSILLSQEVKVLERVNREIEMKVDIKILEERRHNHIQFLMETRYCK